MKILLTILLATVCFSGCRFAEELINMSPPEVVSWKPGTENADPENMESLEIHFSSKMDRNLTEQAFSLSVDDNSVEGIFSWENGSRLCFTPRKGFTAHRLYELSIGKEAEDRNGNSLIREWNARFRTGEDDTAPRVLRVIPEDYSLITDPRQTISFQFSEAVDRQSFRESLSVSPDLCCVQSWEEDSCGVSLLPLEDYQEGEEYSFSLGTGLLDLAGHSLAESFDCSYPVNDPEEPLLTELRCESDGRILSEEGLNSGLEKDSVLSGRMNRALSSGERQSFISLSPDVDFNVDWTEPGDTFTLGFTDPLPWEYVLTLSIGDTDFLLCFDGPGSFPPEILSLHFCADADNPDADEPRELYLNGALGACDLNNSFLDFRIALAEGAYLNRLSLLEALNITSSVLTVQGLGCVEYEDGMTPPPAVPPGAGECLFRIILDVETTGLPGTAVIAIDSSLRDSLDNRMTDRYSITVSQP